MQYIVWAVSLVAAFYIGLAAGAALEQAAEDRRERTPFPG